METRIQRGTIETNVTYSHELLLRLAQVAWRAYDSAEVTESERQLYLDALGDVIEGCPGCAIKLYEEAAEAELKRTETPLGRRVIAGFEAVESKLNGD